MTKWYATKSQHLHDPDAISGHDLNENQLQVLQRQWMGLRARGQEVAGWGGRVPGMEGVGPWREQEESEGGAEAGLSGGGGSTLTAGSPPAVPLGGTPPTSPPSSLPSLMLGPHPPLFCLHYWGGQPSPKEKAGQRQ